MNATQIAGNPLHLIDIIRFKLAATQAWEYSVIKAFMRQQRLVVEFYRCGNRDIVNDEAGCGALVRYDDPVSMSEAMKRLMEDPGLLARCREGALRTIDEKFEIQKWMEKTYAVYEAARKR